MKHLYTTIALASLCIICISGCDLERKDYDQIFPENFYKNESDIKAAVTSAYHLFRINSYGGQVYSHGRGGVNIQSEMVTDEMDCSWGDGGLWERMHTHSWTAGNLFPLESLFGYYNKVSQFRNIILEIENSTAVSDALKNRYIGEVKALRGWLMYLLFDFYGPVPIADDDALKDPQNDILPQILTEAEYAALVEKEFKDAISLLPIKASEWGRVDAGVANMMLLKLYMHQKKWSEAEAVCRELMSSKYGYTLLDNYYDCFSLKTEVNNENIWSITCDNENYVNGWITHTIPSDLPYANPNVERWNGYRMPWEYYHTFESGDKRLDNIVAEYISTANGELMNESNPGTSLLKGAIALKYTVDPNQKGDKSGIDVPVFRYSDVLLSLAECIARKGSVTQECMDLINRVRTRVGLPDRLLADYTDKDKFFDMLLMERGHELYLEGHRRTDLIRFGKFIEFARKVPNNQTADYKVLFPIPNSYIIEYKGALKQNEGY